MDMVLGMTEMQFEVFMFQYFDVKENRKTKKKAYEVKSTLTVREAIIAQYVKRVVENPGWMQDWMNRHVSFAPQKSEIA